MAATNYTPISLYYSSTATNTPSAGNLVYGELAINIADGKLFYKNPSNVVTLLASSAGVVPSPFTANGVVYASSASVLATGSALTFDGTNLVNTSSSVGTPEIAVSNSATSAGSNARLRIKTGVSGATTLGDAFVQFTDSLNFNWAIGAGSSTSNALTFNQYFGLGTNELMRLNSTGLGIGTSSPSQKLQITASGASPAWLYSTNATSGSYFGTSGTGETIVYQTGAYPIQFYTNSTERMRLDSSGNLGIGTSSPTQKLHVNGNIRVEGATSEIFMATGAERTISASGSSSSTALTFKRWNGASYVNDVIMDGSGNLGIGTSSPGAKLDVVGTASISGNVTLSGGTANGVAYLNGSKVLTTGSALTYSSSILGVSDGSITAGNSGVVLTGKYSSGFPSSGSGYFQLQTTNVDGSNGGLSVFTLSGGTLRVSYRILDEVGAGGCFQAWNVAGSEQMRLNSTGLGIGTSSPAYKLHVQNNAANTDTFVGQASTVGLFTQWRYNATTASAYGEISTYGGANNLYIQNQGSNGSVFICVNGGNVGIGTASPNASAILDAQSTTKGVRMPNMTTTQKNAISSPAAGLMVFDTTLAKLCVYSGSAWQTITSV